MSPKQFELFMDKKNVTRLNGFEMSGASAKGDTIDEAVCKFIINHQRNRFFGKLELHFKDGQIVCMRKEEVLQRKDLLRLTAE